MAERDVYLQNPGGTIRVYSGATGTIAVKQGGWLYVYTFYYKTAVPPVVKISGAVEAGTEAFYAWFDGAKWEENGDPPVTDEGGSSQIADSQYPSWIHPDTVNIPKIKVNDVWASAILELVIVNTQPYFKLTKWGILEEE